MRHAAAMLIGLTLIACKKDNDKDGFTSDVDCNDNNPEVFPEATELCNDLDDDCDGVVDEDAGDTWYLDADADGWGDPESTTLGCEQPTGYVGNEDDCDDADDRFYPGAAEDDCTDPNDYNCDGSTGYVDADEDGFAACEDCDDSRADVSPAADEVCDDVDNDCDSLVDGDDDTVTGAGTWYIDYDGDGAGSDRFWEVACDQPEGYVDNLDDCDDADAQTFPGADELCDEEDNDCDDLVDEDAVDQLTWYADTDADGYGDDLAALAACVQPEGYVDLPGDCDDTDVAYNPGAVEDDCEDPNDYNCDGSTGYTDGDGDGFAACEECNDADELVNPDAAEVCDEQDNDCDGLLDSDDPGVEGESTWYLDYDDDGYGSDRYTRLSCDLPDGYVDNADDCDDASGTSFPGAPESCDGDDNDCDDEIDEDAIDVLTWYQDVDGDGYGLSDSTTTACAQPDGYADLFGDCDDGDVAYNPGAVEDDCTDPNDYNCDGATGYDDGDGDGFAACEDCDDEDPLVHPDADEVCDGADNDCDGRIDSDDDDATDESTWYLDYDGDSYGSDRFSVQACEQPDGYVDNSEDCDDGALASYPGAPETCDGEDNDCDDVIDEDAVDRDTFWLDVDGDGYGLDGSTTTACELPDGYAAAGGDCDDGNIAYNPGATEDDCTDPADYNCDGATGYADGDGDGFAACEECNDADGAVNPDATEVCDDVDNDCDGRIDSNDDDVTGESTWYFDYDADDFGSDSITVTACDRPGGYVSVGGDCDDGRDEVFPGGIEVCDGLDNDCNDVVDDDAGDFNTYWADGDSDGYGDPDGALDACALPDGYVRNSLDCDDDDNDINPAADEVCDGDDNDCDDLVDDGDTDTLYGSGDLHYADLDVDGYGSYTSYVLSCDAPDGYVDFSGDCDDGDDAINPAADEVCDGLDNNCVDGIDEDSAVDALTWYLDADGDDYGLLGSTWTACEEPTGYTAVADDCDDSDELVNPSAAEVCNDDIDNDCDGGFSGCELSLSDADVILTGEAALDDAGIAFTGIGDLDGDGFDELMVGARDNDSAATDAGAAYLFMGSLASGTLASLSTADAIVLGADSTDRLGRDLASGFDVDGDGLDDVLIAAPNDEEGGTATGTAYLFSGADLLAGGTLSPSDAFARWLGRTSYDYLSVRVELADLTGDGTADVVAAANGDDGGGSSSGAIYMMAGPVTAGTVDLGSGSPWTAKIVGENASDGIGLSLAVRGDLDGDGTSDLVVGATADATTGTGAGAAYVVLGGMTGTVDLGDADAKLLGNATSGGLGSSTAYLGDQDGDGFDDVAIGASLDDTVGADAGAVFLLGGTGSVAGLDGLTIGSVAAASLLGPSTGHQLGAYVGGNGDFDGDGTQDLLAASTAGGVAGQGVSYLLVGPLAGSLTTADALAAFTGEEADDASGGPVGYVGDLTGSGTDVLGIGATANDRAGTDAGALYLVYEVGP
ncbi:hypothetical protein L6R53_27035 [Myxococcota bacterium]|nr:hypothetical protein [Myxococcota bacterium]